MQSIDLTTCYFPNSVAVNLKKTPVDDNDHDDDGAVDGNYREFTLFGLTQDCTKT